MLLMIVLSSTKLSTIWLSLVTALIFMGPNGLKNYPLNRYAVERDGDGNVIEIVTREKNSSLVKNF